MILQIQDSAHTLRYWALCSGVEKEFVDALDGLNEVVKVEGLGDVGVGVLAVGVL
ncbi:hypothetical protein [Streptomyces fuscigenes]|uniref:hypothetical protein n=1 Tax=Streptomyces fuscigenes TaxID=1528880 RepID=UPI0027E15403|nr:hypothetical protein [Streptomyces fuscigenes]